MIPETFEKTIDTFYSPGLKISQPRHGLRFSSDTVALVEFLHITPSESLLDLCTGVGTIPLLLWHRSIFRYAVGVELQPDLVHLASLNIRQNHLTEKIHILEKDVRHLTWDDFRNLPCGLPLQGFDVVSANPPYWPLRRGRINRSLQEAIARHEIHLVLPQLLKACRMFLKTGGRLYLVHLAVRESEVLHNLRNQGFEVKQEKLVHRRSSLLLVEAKLLAAGCTEFPV